MGAKVVVVDDQDMIRDVLVETLQLGGYEAFQACNGKEGLRVVEEHRPDLVITDVRMPGMDGFEFSRRLRDTSETRILMLSGLDEQSQDDHPAGLIDAYMTKPIMLQDFLAVVESIITGKALKAPSNFEAAA